MKRNKIRTIIATLSATMMLSGCGVPTEVSAPTFGNPAQTISAEPATTVAATEPSQSQFKFGQEVWSVRYSVDDDDAYLVRYAVVAQNGDLVAVVPMFTTDVDKLRQTLVETAEMPLDGTKHLYLVLADNCYLSQEEAQTVADAENAEG